MTEDHPLYYTNILRNLEELQEEFYELNPTLPQSLG